MIRQVICRYASVFCILSYAVRCCRGLPNSLEKELVCDTPDSLRDENRYLERVFHKNNYNTDFIKRYIYRPTEADATNRNPTPLTTVTIPYIKGTSETISRILQPYNIRVTQKLQLLYDNY